MWLVVPKSSSLPSERGPASFLSQEDERVGARAAFTEQTDERAHLTFPKAAQATRNHSRLISGGPCTIALPTLGYAWHLRIVYVNKRFGVHGASLVVARVNAGRKGTAMRFAAYRQ